MPITSRKSPHWVYRAHGKLVQFLVNGCALSPFLVNAAHRRGIKIRSTEHGLG